MKIPNDYMELSYRMEIVEDKDEGGFVVSYPDLLGCITCGETRDIVFLEMRIDDCHLRHMMKSMLLFNTILI